MSSLGFFFICLASALTTSVFAQGTNPNEDLIKSGNYNIQNCDAGKSGSMAEELQTLLPMIKKNLQAVRNDAALGTKSQHGFSALFKSDANIDHVSATYRRMALGFPVNLPPPRPGSRRNPALSIASPTILCIKPEAQPNVARGCRYNPEFASILEDQYVQLCPSFWEFDDEPESSHCPRLWRNTLFPNNDALSKNKEAILVHELAHLYGIHRLPKVESETYALVDAVKLSEADSLLNAANFAFYYAGKH